jgi:hypothetical protein
MVKEIDFIFTDDSYLPTLFDFSKYEQLEKIMIMINMDEKRIC